MGTFSEPSEYPGAAGQSLTLAGPLLPWPTEGLRGCRLPIGWKLGVGWRLQGTLRKDLGLELCSLAESTDIPSPGILRSSTQDW